MSRPLFYPTRDQLVTDPYGSPVAGQRVRVYIAPTGGSPVTDLLFIDPSTGSLGSAVTAGYLVSDGNGYVPAFAGPDGSRDLYYLDCGPYGSRTAILAESGGGGGGSGTPADGSVTAAKLASDVASAIGGSITATKTSAYTAAPGQTVPVDASSAAVTITLPAATRSGDRVVVKKVDSSTNAVTIARAGSDVINTSSTSLSLIFQHQSTVLRSSGAGVWLVEAGDLPNSALASTYGPGGTAGNAAASDVTALTTTVATKAPLASPALTGNPTAPTAAAGDNDTSIATTAFVQTAAAGAAAGLSIVFGG